MDYLDLSKKKYELEKIFDSLINKIPDLCHPASCRLENEDDFFNQTKDLRLEPFRKQEVFERCVTPTQDERRHNAVGSPTGDYLDVVRPHSCTLPVDQGKGRISSQSRSKVAFFSTGTTRREESRVRRTEAKKAPENRMSSQRQEALKRHQQKSDLNHRYSKIKLRKPTLSIEDQSKESLDKIFIGDLESSDSNYPFANPMPDCMLTKENIDNLRDIIVSSTDIEWRMLTPVRPSSEYEENFFDKLIQLHRNRYKYRQELAATALGAHRSSPSGSGRSPFKHTRHSFMLPGATHQATSGTHHRGHHKNCFCLDVRLKGRFGAQRARTRSMAHAGAAANLNIPMLMLTVDDKTASQPLTAKGADEDDETSGHVVRSRDLPSESKQLNDDLSEFSYEFFSRFSRRNQRFARGQVSKMANAEQSAMSSLLGQEPALDEPDAIHGDALLDGQIEDIMSGLLNADI